MLKNTLGKLGSIASRLAAAAGTLVAAAGLAAVGLALLLAGVVVIQQVLSRFVGVDVRLGDALTWAGRAFTLLGRAAGVARAVEAT